MQDEAGEPVTGALVQVEANEGSSDLDEMTFFLPPNVDPEGGFTEREPGVYVKTDVTAGRYHVRARVPGLAPGTGEVELWQDEAEVTLVCSAGRYLDLKVVDALTGEPVGNALGRIMGMRDFGFAELGGDMTDPTGHARLGPFEVLEDGDAETTLVVRHPRYADHAVDIDPYETRAEVALVAGGVLAGRVHWGGEVPDRLYMLLLEHRGNDGMMEFLELPRFGMTGLDGGFRVESLAAGEVRVELVERFLHQDPVGMMNDEFEPVTVYRDRVVIESGQTTELIIDLTPSGQGPAARIRGRVRVGGREVADASVQVRGTRTVSTTTDVWGRFETEDFPVYEGVRVRIDGVVVLSDGRNRSMRIHDGELELRAGDVYDLDIDLMPLEVQVEVVDAVTKDPVYWTEVQVHPTGDGTNRSIEGSVTDHQGRAMVWVPEPGDHVLVADAEGYAERKQSIEVPREGLGETVRVELAVEVPCTGRVLAPAAGAGPQGFSYIHVQAEDQGAQAWVMLEGPDYEFTLEGLVPGTYRAEIILGGTRGEPASFELGPEGDLDLVLEFVEAP